MEYYVNFFDHWTPDETEAIKRIRITEDELEPCAMWLQDRDFDITYGRPRFEVKAWVHDMKLFKFFTCYSATHGEFSRFLEHLRITKHVDKVL